VNIPLLDLTSEINELREEFQAAINGVLRSGHFIMGPNVAAFEAEAAAYLGVKHAIGLNSGTDALVIALKAAGIGPDDEVITTAFSFFATAEAISQVGAKPVFVDIDPLTFNIDSSQIEAAITRQTRALLPVHLFGQAADMTPVLALAEKYQLRVIEDVAQAFGAEYHGRKLGTLGDVGCYSFFPTKNLGAFGDGGMIGTNDDQLAEFCRMLRVHGARKKYFNELIGYNSRLDELQAAVLRVKLPRIDRMLELRREAGLRYHALLANLDDRIVLPGEAAYGQHVFNQYTLRVKAGKREQLQQYLSGQGIGTMVFYPLPLHQLPPYAGWQYSLTEAERAAREVLSIPIWPQITPEIQEQVAVALKVGLA